MVHDIHNCGVKGGTRSRLHGCGGHVELHKYDSSGVYMNTVLAGSILGVSLLVCGVVSDVVMGRTAPLTSKRCILYIYSTNTGTEYFKHALYYPFFS